MPQAPEILLIPGTFFLPHFYYDVVQAVAAYGYSIRALDLPSTGCKSGVKVAPCMDEDAALIAAEVSKLADQGKDVMLVSHSYGSVPATQSTKGLGKTERQSQGKTGGVARLAYMNCTLLPPDELLAIDTRPKDELAKIAYDDDWMWHSNIPLSAAVCFSDLPKDEAEMWAQRLTRQSFATLQSDLSHAGYEDIPVSYLLSEDDLSIIPAAQKATIAMIERMSGQKVDVTSINAGHFPIISQPSKVADWILNLLSQMQTEQLVEADG